MEEKEKKSFISWVKEHKAELIIAGITLATIIIAIKYRKELAELWATLRKAIEKKTDVIPEITPVTVKPVVTANVVDLKEAAVEIEECAEKACRAAHDVKMHIRVLSGGRQASAAKLAEAADLNIVLKPGETLVDPYRTTGIAA